MAYAMVLSNRKCKNCGSSKGRDIAAILGETAVRINFRCSLCHVELCLDCVKNDIEGDGSYFICPQCQAHLQLPIPG